MTLATPARLTLAVIASAVIHTAALFPVKAPSGPYVSTPFPASMLNVRLHATPTLFPEIAPDAPTRTPPVDATPAQAPAPPVDRLADIPPARPDADRLEPVAARVPPVPAPPQASSEREGQGRPGVRIALPDEVKVRVRLYDAKAEDNPNEVMELPSGKYVYFNAPRLKQTAHPLADAKPHYPTGRLDYPHGAVMLLLLIDQDGKLEKTAVMCANPAFEESALASIQNMRFGAARDANGPVKSYMLVEFGYGLGAPCAPLPNNLQLDQRPG